jgi:hypothetical protein
LLMLLLLQCYSVGDCYGRSLGNLGSSKNLPATGALGGLVSTNCNVSDLCNYNIVWFAYLDGNSFSGLLDEPVIFNNGTADVPLYFRGRANIDAVIDAVSRNVMNSPNLLANARNVIETGCSAGGLATYLHADYLMQKIPHSGQYLSMPISGYFINAANPEGIKVYSNQIQVIYTLSNASTNAACQAHYEPLGQGWRCNMAEYVYPFIQAPIHPFNSFVDSWQTGCIMTAEPVVNPNNTHVNGNCSADAAYAACAGNPSTCTVDQLQDVVIPFGQYSITSYTVINAAKSQAPGSGAFWTSCHTHCEAQSNSCFDNFAINGVTMRAAAQSWITANIASNGTSPAADHTYLDCQYSPGKVPCNPTCG